MYSGTTSNQTRETLVSTWWEELNKKYAESKGRLALLPKNSFTLEFTNSKYACKVGLVSFNNEEAARTSDFDLMVWYDGNPCFGGTVSRRGKTSEHPHGSAYVTVYTD